MPRDHAARVVEGRAGPQTGNGSTHARRSDSGSPVSGGCSRESPRPADGDCHARQVVREDQPQVKESGRAFLALVECGRADRRSRNCLSGSLPNLRRVDEFHAALTSQSDLFSGFDLQIVLDAECAGHTFRLDIDNIAIEFARHDAFQPNVSVLNDNVNRGYR